MFHQPPRYNSFTARPLSLPFLAFATIAFYITYFQYFLFLFQCFIISYSLRPILSPAMIFVPNIDRPSYFKIFEKNYKHKSHMNYIHVLLSHKNKITNYKKN